MLESFSNIMKEEENEAFREPLDSFNKQQLPKLLPARSSIALAVRVSHPIFNRIDQSLLSNIAHGLELRLSNALRVQKRSV
jgi:hypothetical protein